MLSPEKTKPSGTLNRLGFFTSDELSDDETELMYKIPDQGAIFNIPLGLLSSHLNYESRLVDI